MAQNLSWDEMLRMFRMLGGAADNIAIADGAPGRGLMAMDPNEPVHVRIPANLLFRVQDIGFEDNQPRLKGTADVGHAERLFFEAYQGGFSWGGGGGSRSTAFVRALDALPADVRSLLIDEFGLGDLLVGDPAERAQKQFLAGRSVVLEETEFITPVIELANHGSAGLRCYIEHGFNMQGTVEGEILVNRGVYDPFSLFRRCGVVSSEPGAFSQPTELQVADRRLIIFQDTSAPVKLGNVWVPNLRIEGGTAVLPFLMIGHRAMPKQSRAIFRALAADAHIDKADEAFDAILQFNWSMFLKLLTALEPHNGEMVQMLRKVARFQLEAISHCIGSIEFEAPKPPKEEVWSLSIQ
jgi:hypothetical protein